MADPTPLSPAAQAVDRAIANQIQLLGEIAPSRQIAAAAPTEPKPADEALTDAPEIKTAPRPRKD